MMASSSMDPNRKVKLQASRRGSEVTTTQPFVGLGLNPRVGVEWTCRLYHTGGASQLLAWPPQQPCLPVSLGDVLTGQMAGAECG